ncbi:MAG TPA: hypothetical protein V6C85_09420 [Allocoleopsis sp.]
MKFKWFTVAALTSVAAATSVISPALADWVQGYGLISQSGKTVVEGFAATEYDPGDIESGSVEYYYLTESFGKKVIGKMTVNDIGQGGTTGVFHNSSIDNSQGCYGRFEIKQASSGDFDVTWYFDGTIKGFSCPDVGTSITLPNMRIGRFSKWVD